MSVMLPCSCLLIGPDFGHTSVGPGCMLHCISVLWLLRFSHRLGTSAHSDSQQEQLQHAGHEPVLPCACLWTGTCLCLTALFRRASTHILRASYFADIGIPLTQPPISALRALCLRSWPVNWTVSLVLTVSSRHYFGFISSFSCQRSYFTVIIVSEMHFNTALHDCILYPSQYLRSRHFTGLCKSVHPWGRVSEIQFIKGSVASPK